jgi:acyl dehydratase
MPATRIDTLEQLESFAGVSEWHTVDQTAIDQFARLTGDEQWIHVDAERARRESPWGVTVAHGFFTLSLLSQLAFETVELQLGQKAVINYGLNKVRFPAPARSGARVRGHFGLVSTTRNDGGIDIVWRVAVEAEGSEKPVCAAEWIWRVLV